MQEKPANITEIAKKQRYLYLLGKVKQGKQLGSSEIRELESYENMAKSGTNKNDKFNPSKPLADKRHERFCQEFIVDHNKTRAAKDAGFSPKTAASQASRLLKKVNIKKRVEYLENQLCGKANITAEKVLRELGRIAFSNMNDFAVIEGGKVVFEDFSELTPDQLACVAEVSESRQTRIKIKLHDKLKALELIGRHLSMFNDNMNVRFPEGSCGVLAVPVEVDKDAWQAMAQNKQNTTTGKRKRR